MSETSREAAYEKRPFGSEIWQAKSTTELTDEEMGQIRAAKTPAEYDYDYEEDLKRLDMNVSRTGSSTTVYFELRDGHGNPGPCLSAVSDGG